MKRDSRWTQEEFEDQIEDMITAAYHTPVARKYTTMRVVAGRISQGILEGMRNSGPHMPGKDRIVLPHSFGFDLVNDRLPERACISIPGEDGFGRQIAYLRRVDNFMTRQDLAEIGVGAMPGDMPWFRVSYLSANKRKLHGATIWCWIDLNGRVRLSRMPGLDPAIDNVDAALDMICTALQAQADRRFCWEIAADEGYGKASLGCTADEVKSLLYARQLPVTATGRKRPILHMVAAHRRRLKEGIDIDINQFLRGVDEVTMDGTRFKVSAPENLEPRS